MISGRIVRWGCVVVLNTCSAALVAANPIDLLPLVVKSVTRIDDACRVEILVEDESIREFQLFRSASQHPADRHGEAVLGLPRTLVRTLGDHDAYKRVRRHESSGLMLQHRFFRVVDGPLANGRYHYQAYIRLRQPTAESELMAQSVPFPITLEGCRSPASSE